MEIVYSFVVVPVNTTATVCVPAADPTAVTESGKPASQAEGVKFLQTEGGLADFEVGSGTYKFVSESDRYAQKSLLAN